MLYNYDITTPSSANIIFSILYYSYNVYNTFTYAIYEYYSIYFILYSPYPSYNLFYMSYFPLLQCTTLSHTIFFTIFI